VVQLRFSCGEQKRAKHSATTPISLRTLRARHFQASIEGIWLRAFFHVREP
jgi:hypothetical protein